MTSRATNIGAWCLALSLALSTCMVAAGTGTTGAYFTDTKSGRMTGTYALPDPPAPTIPYRLEAGGSKQLHWGPGDGEPACGDPIAQADTAGAMFLDFGDVLPGHGDARPDVLRLVSLVGGSRTVMLSVSGAMSDFVTDVRLGGGIRDLLDGHDTRSVYMKIRVPDDALPGAYVGVLTIHVQGWDDDVRLPMVIVVCDKSSRGNSGKEMLIEAPDSSSATTTTPPDAPSTPCDPSLPATPTTEPVPSPESTPAVTPTPTMEPRSE